MTHHSRLATATIAFLAPARRRSFSYNARHRAVMRTARQGSLHQRPPQESRAFLGDA